MKTPSRTACAQRQRLRIYQHTSHKRFPNFVKSESGQHQRYHDPEFLFFFPSHNATNDAQACIIDCSVCVIWHHTSQSPITHNDFFDLPPAREEREKKTPALEGFDCQPIKAKS
mmetsp:Transcript_29654/g.61905  ORF Transcript_29654/g.61905 Transcript_29654/m.61905 type:complete len:114 (-) Transcript_29654:275-616(-)